MSEQRAIRGKVLHFIQQKALGYPSVTDKDDQHRININHTFFLCVFSCC